MQDGHHFRCDIYPRVDAVAEERTVVARRVAQAMQIGAAFPVMLSRIDVRLHLLQLQVEERLPVRKPRPVISIDSVRTFDAYPHVLARRHIHDPGLRVLATARRYQIKKAASIGRGPESVNRVALAFARELFRIYQDLFCAIRAIPHHYPEIAVAGLYPPVEVALPALLHSANEGA